MPPDTIKCFLGVIVRRKRNSLSLVERLSGQGYSPWRCCSYDSKAISVCQKNIGFWLVPEQLQRQFGSSLIALSMSCKE